MMREVGLRHAGLRRAVRCHRRHMLLEMGEEDIVGLGMKPIHEKKFRKALQVLRRAGGGGRPLVRRVVL